MVADPTLALVGCLPWDIKLDQNLEEKYNPCDTVGYKLSFC